MNEKLIHALLDAALILFGEFNHVDGPERRVQPFSPQLEMLVSYPEIIQLAAEAAAAKLNEFARPDRLLCLPDSLPLATLVSNISGVPLVYLERHGHESTIVGAYDIGHPTLLLTNHQALTTPDALIQSARRVGLEVTGILTMLGWGSQDTWDGVPLSRVLTLEEVITSAASLGSLSHQHAERCRSWIAQAEVTPRQD